VTPQSPARRRLLLAAPALAATGWAGAQPGRPPARTLVVGQLFDTAPAQQDVAKDFLVGSRAAWQEINARGGLGGHAVQHLTLEVDSRQPASLQASVRTLRDHPGCLALSGTAGDFAASRVAALLRQEGIALAHAAPWLQAGDDEPDDQTFPIFASRREQVAHAFRSLSVMNVSELGVVYASELEFTAFQEDVTRAARALGLRLQVFRAGGELLALGQKMGNTTPALLLFLGGTPELAQFSQGLERQARQRYLIALGDINLQTLQQMGGGRSTPVIATQPVPVTSASLPVVRAYREALSRFFDEPPTALSLAGYIAARYTFEVLRELRGEPSRAQALAAFQQRGSLDIGGFRVAFDGRRRAGAYVTQSMLTPDGRVIG